MMNQSKNTPVDLGEGKVFKTIIRLAVPLVIASVVNILYSLVDRIFIGNMQDVGGLAIAGVGIALPLITIVSAFAAIAGMGAAPLASIKLGEGDKEGAERLISNSFFLLCILSVVLTVVVLLFKDKLLYAFGATENIFEYGNTYITTYIFGTFFVMMSLGLNVFINAQGFTKIGMRNVLVGAAINIVLDPILIYGLNLGVMGAALATVISQGVSAVLIIKFLLSKNAILRLKLKNFKPSLRIILGFCALGVSPFVMQSTEGIVQIIFNSQIKAYAGSNVDSMLTVMTVCLSTMMIITVPAMSFSQGASPFLSYNYGKGNLDRVKSGFLIMIVVSFIATIVLSSIVLIAPNVVARMFNGDPAFLELTKKYMRIFFIAYALMGVQLSAQCTLIALGRAKISVFLAVLRKIILLIPLLFILPNFFELDGIFIAEPVADFIAIITTIIVFIVNFKKIMSSKTIKK